MIRIAVPLRRRALVALAMLVLLILLLPARLALAWFGLDAGGLTARAADGSIWSGRLVEAQAGGVPLGDLDLHLRPLPLLAGRAHLDLKGDAVSGGLLATRHLVGVDQVNGRVPLGSRLAPLPVAALVLTDVTVRFEDDVCLEASGTVRAELQGDLGGLQLPGGLTGPARCDAGALLLPLTGQSGLERLSLRLAADGRWRAEVTVAGDDPALRDRLTVAGFVPGPAGLRLNLEGRW